MCLTYWPYNGSTLAYPDGTCEWVNSLIPAGQKTMTPAQTTMDSPDDVMHTLSDFDKFANSILNQDAGTLSKTFKTWYSQAAHWIAPKCETTCTQKEIGIDDGSCLNTDKTCIQNTSDGRLLTIYAAKGYPGIATVGEVKTPVDKFKDWNDLMTSWLNNSYASSTVDNNGAWCVPGSTMNPTTGSATEDKWINTNSGTTIWGGFAPCHSLPEL